MTYTWKQLTEEAAKHGLSKGTVRDRYHKGIRDPEKLFAPPRERRKKFAGRTIYEWLDAVKDMYGLKISYTSFQKTFNYHTRTMGRSDVEALDMMSAEYRKQRQAMLEAGS